VTEFKVPELGENVAGGDVTRVLVKAGDTIAREQAVVELETDKATIEVPSSVAGVVKEIKVKQGDKVTVGQVLLTVDDAGAAPAKEAEKPAPKQAKQESKEEPKVEPKGESKDEPKEERAQQQAPKPEKVVAMARPAATGRSGRPAAIRSRRARRAIRSKARPRGWRRYS
jgi:pyruvate dehydrogenase E2 component (dihydrolipoamide acetyltransferase)